MNGMIGEIISVDDVSGRCDFKPHAGNTFSIRKVNIKRYCFSAADRCARCNGLVDLHSFPQCGRPTDVVAASGSNPSAVELTHAGASSADLPGTGCSQKVPRCRQSAASVSSSDAACVTCVPSVDTPFAPRADLANAEERFHD